MIFGTKFQREALALCFVGALTVEAADTSRVVLKNGTEMSGLVLRERDEEIGRAHV
jgi:hypothetical protein